MKVKLMPSLCLVPNPIKLVESSKLPFFVIKLLRDRSIFAVTLAISLLMRGKTLWYSLKRLKYLISNMKILKL